jgi:hypothetical protein
MLYYIIVDPDFKKPQLSSFTRHQGARRDEVHYLAKVCKFMMTAIGTQQDAQCQTNTKSSI